MKAVISSKWLLVSSQTPLQGRLDCFSFLQNEKLKHFQYFGKKYANLIVFLKATENINLFEETLKCLLFS